MARLHLLRNLVVSAFSAASLVTASHDSSCEDVLTRDVVVIGGGSSGTYASIRLQQLGHSVAVVEKNDRLGGHVNTFVDPTSKKTFDFGVIYFENSTVTLNYMKHLDIPIVAASFTGQAPSYANFDGDAKLIKTLPASIPYSNETAVGEGLFEFVEIMEQYPFLANGYNLPNPVPEDLTLTFGDFLKKHDLGAIASAVFQTNQGVGNLLAQSTLYMMKYFNIPVVEASLGTGLPLLTTAASANQDIYNSALAKLHGSVFLNSHVSHIDRECDDGVEVFVTTPEGPRVIKAKKLLVAIEPILDNLESLHMGLDLQEVDVFRQLNHSYYWDMVIRDSGIPQDVSIIPIDLEAPLGLLPAPTLQSIGPNPIGAPDLTVAYFNSAHYLSNEQVKEKVLATLAKLVKANGFHSTGKPEFMAFHNHSPFQATVSADAIRKGFYRDMNALQGGKDTFFTGAAWQAHNSAEIWNWSEETLLPMLLASLRKSHRV